MFIPTICGLNIVMCNWDQLFKIHYVTLLNSSLYLLAKITGTQYVIKQISLWLKLWKFLYRKLCMSMNSALFV